MPLMPGVFLRKKKDGTIQYRSSITHKNKHISLGSFSTEADAHNAYLEAKYILSTSDIDLKCFNPQEHVLSFDKWVSLYNFAKHNMYLKTPILLKDHFFLYYYSPEIVLKFDVDDLFYFSNHKIMKRGGHLFVSDYGMQVNILSRYGIKNYAVLDRDYKFVNGDIYDFRYANIKVINKYYGVQKITVNGFSKYLATIHINGNYKIGTYETEIEAAIAYNKAVDLLRQKGINRNYFTNYIIELNEITYASKYHKIRISKSIRDL